MHYKIIEIFALLNFMNNLLLGLDEFWIAQFFKLLLFKHGSVKRYNTEPAERYF